MKNIQSKDNLVVRQAMKVAAGRDKTRILLEGVHLCEEWLKRYDPPESVLVQASAVDRPEIARLLAITDTARQYLLADALFNAIATVQTPQGIMFVATRPVPAAISRLSTTALWLDRLQDPGNLGTILRTAAAAGVKDILLSAGCVGAWSPKVLRSAQGAHFALDIYEHQHFPDIRDRLDMPILASSLVPGARSLYEDALPAACLWVVGNEGQGVHPDILTVADQCIFIPQSDAVESLNAAVATAILLFEQRRQHMRG
ncbi:TrmH family RNA methyltransferase [Advenella mimigardefordensis]|uniref:Putative tRNA/rRNA methyltransferase n=1 Tax=Advenella mimigardefordensis (strain DSM 17166 / LMG 22922 / DPN7) TaxID=1247726 RepID=W0PAZ4_ADVMD|nr:RNA methyltransferase [Advenella mimigardefordensis]AHG64029.1 putative tRNA/rRNA methyltransferase [Advenella mimigardefordensis DPN7]